MAPTTSETRAAALSQHSYVSIGLMLALIAGATIFGRQLQRLDAIENEVRELRGEVREIRTLLVRTQSLPR
jgi:hypothetical protein